MTLLSKTHAHTWQAEFLRYQRKQEGEKTCHGAKRQMCACQWTRIRSTTHDKHRTWCTVGTEQTALEKSRVLPRRSPEPAEKETRWSLVGRKNRVVCWIGPAWSILLVCQTFYLCHFSYNDMQRSDDSSSVTHRPFHLLAFSSSPSIFIPPPFHYHILAN